MNEDDVTLYSSDEIRLDILREMLDEEEYETAYSCKDPSWVDVYDYGIRLMSMCKDRYDRFYVFEYWNDDCFVGFDAKYGRHDPETIRKKIPPRMNKIGSMLIPPLKMISFEYKEIKDPYMWDFLSDDYDLYEDEKKPKGLSITGFEL